MYGLSAAEEPWESVEDVNFKKAPQGVQVDLTPTSILLPQWWRVMACVNHNQS
jgi:hypothetical protein